MMPTFAPEKKTPDDLRSTEIVVKVNIHLPDAENMFFERNCPRSVESNLNKSLS